MREGYRGTDPEENSGRNSGGDTVSLNTLKEDLSGHDQVDPPDNPLEAAEDLVAGTMNLFMDLVHNLDKVRALGINGPF